MLFYKGTKASGYLQPRSLASYDLVITTYNVLQSETNYVDLPHTNSSEGRRFRNPKRFMAVPAPLPCINWLVEGSGCSTEVERTLCNSEVVGLKSSVCWGFSLLYPLSSAS